MGRTLGIATIGQAPRDDIAALFAAHAPAATRVLLRGCARVRLHRHLSPDPR
jgi:protein AroM